MSEKLTPETVIGEGKILAKDLKKFFVQELGSYVYNEKVGTLNITHIMGNFKGRTLKSIVDEFSNEEEKDKKVVRETAEEVAAEYLSGENLENFMNFATFLRSNKITPKHRERTSFRNKAVCRIGGGFGIEKENWAVSFSHFTREKWFTNIDEIITDPELIKFIHDHVNPPGCAGCGGRKNMTLLGKQFDAVCNCYGVGISKPNAEDVEQLKKLILVIKDAIVNLPK